MRFRFSVLTYPLLLATRDTVMAPTPASCATSATVGNEPCLETLCSINVALSREGRSRYRAVLVCYLQSRRRSSERRIESSVILMVVTMSYNFNHFDAPKRSVTPQHGEVTKWRLIRSVLRARI